jgi:hypothetical protein
MDTPRIVARDEWLTARKALMAKEKEFTRLRDRLTAERHALPWVKVEKPYVFEAPQGKVTLADLFDGRSQLFVKHFMMGPGQAGQCVGCRDHAVGALGLDAHQRRRERVVGTRAKQEKPRHGQERAADDLDGERQGWRPAEAPRVERHEHDPGDEAQHHEIDDERVAAALPARARPAVALGEQRRIVAIQPVDGADAHGEEPPAEDPALGPAPVTGEGTGSAPATRERRACSGSA